MIAILTSWLASSRSSTRPTLVSATTSRCGTLSCDRILKCDPLYRRSVKVARGAVFNVAWTRLADWYDALPAVAIACYATR